MSPPFSRISALAEDVRAGRTTAEALTRSTLDAIDRHASLGAYLHVARDAALAAARGVDARRAAGEPLGPLAGVPVAVKDAFATVDAPTTAGSKILTRDGQANTGWRSPYDATAVARLRAADAVVVGKTNLDELAMGSSGENSAFGPTRHPLDPERIPGGSSSGSAVAVACDSVPLALGSDTGGSIRQPAGLCGVVGLKPTYGRISRYGLIAYASSLDTVGTFSRDVRSAADALAVLAGSDPHDSTSLRDRPDDYAAACDRDPRGLRVGVPREYFGDGLDVDVRESVERAIARLASAGCEVAPIDLPHTRWGVATYYVLATAEASSNLARLDGVRFGLRVEEARGGIDGLYGRTRAAGFGREVKRRILLGTFVLSSGYYDAYYGRAQRARAAISAEFAGAFAAVDVIAAPISPMPAFRLGEKLEDPLAMYLADVYTLPASLAGLPAISVPADPVPARSDRPALPTGLQLIAPRLEEARLLTVAAACETRARP